MKDPNVSSYGRGRAAGATASSLLEQLKMAEPAGWSRLVHLYGPLVYGWCRRMGLQPEDAADVVQEVYRSVAAKILEFRWERPAAFRSWLKTITRNKVRDFWRRARREPAGVGGTAFQLRMAELAELEPGDADPAEDQREVDDLYRRVLELVRREYTERTWQAFSQVVLQGRQPSDVAGDLGMSTNAVYVAKSRVLSRIRSEFGEVLE